MKFLKYKYKDTIIPGWDFSEVDFSNINLLVGDTASGKTRLLNTIINIGEFVKGNYKSGNWKITFEHEKNKYTWEIISEPDINHIDKIGKITKEILWKHSGEKLIPLIERDLEKFILDGAKIPGKLSQSETAIGLFKEDPKIKPIYEALSFMSRRLFSIDSLNKVGEIIPITSSQILPENFTEKQSCKQISEMDLGVNSKMYFVRKHSYSTFKKIVTTYKKFFPFIKNVKIRDFSDLHLGVNLGGKAPVLMIQETGSDNFIQFAELSSGMQKVFLLIMDIYLLPDNSIYIIDEYENSLGVSAIDFFPEFVLALEKEVQFFITSHHPYLINNLPVKNWYVFHRDGLNVTIRFGSELIEKYGKSKQQSFLKLLNDPFYSRK
jgi:hypothetical protein